MYLVTVLGNLLTILAISSDSHPHTPKYFFLPHFSLADICFISTTVPKMIVDIQTQITIVAICHSLHYLVIMNPHLCGSLVLVSVLFSLFESQLHHLIILQFSYFKNVDISNFFCDPSQLLSLACSDKFTNNIVMYFIGVIFGFFPISGIIFSYYKIVSSILRNPSAGGEYKASSTCGSHLAVGGLFYGTAIGVCLDSATSHSPGKGVVASVLYTVVTPC
ncbi:olfactory receptor 7E178-like [Marmota monax]|uniref:olfactory receptor 7E178-like n=1 Tax=Marmota monax TaxID=9995 RepID=UPI001EB05B28|nr:olfactory receptor 7E178-like [Marmota monax]